MRDVELGAIPSGTASGSFGILCGEVCGVGLPMVEDRHTMQIVERCEIAGHDGALRCACCRSNDEVVGTAWAAGLTYGDEQFGVLAATDRS